MTKMCNTYCWELKRYPESKKYVFPPLLTQIALSVKKLATSNDPIGGYRQFCQRGSNSENVVFLLLFFKLMKRELRIQIPLKAGHHLPASETPF